MRSFQSHRLETGIQSDAIQRDLWGEEQTLHSQEWNWSSYKTSFRELPVPATPSPCEDKLLVHFCSSTFTANRHHMKIHSSDPRLLYKDFPDSKTVSSTFLLFIYYLVLDILLQQHKQSKKILETKIRNGRKVILGMHYFLCICMHYFLKTIQKVLEIHLFSFCRKWKLRHMDNKELRIKMTRSVSIGSEFKKMTVSYTICYYIRINIMKK